MSAGDITNLNLSFVCGLMSIRISLHPFSVFWKKRMLDSTIFRKNKYHNICKYGDRKAVQNKCSPPSPTSPPFIQGKVTCDFRFASLDRETIPNKSAAGSAWCPTTALTLSEVTLLNLCTSSGHALYLYQVLQNYLERYQSYRVDMISILEITKGNNSAKKIQFPY